MADADRRQVTEPDWFAWHDAYDDPESDLSGRLRVVQERIISALDEAPAGPLRVVSLCAGQSRDLLGVLPGHPRARDVTARLVERDARNAGQAQAAAVRATLFDVEVLIGDASRLASFADLLPADLLLLCGVFGHIPDHEIRAVVGLCGQFVRTGGSVIWTRGRREPDRIAVIASWFEDAGFERVALTRPEEPFAVGHHRLRAATASLRAPAQIFHFGSV
jgi:hypothetical protein